MIATFGPAALVGAAFARCRAQHRAAFMPFLVAGDPTAELSSRFVRTALDAGADLIELGIPFSDPLADGPVVAAASARALAQGMTFEKAIAFARAFKKHQVPLLGFTYYNLVSAFGCERSAHAFAAAGLCGVIIPDLPLEEAGMLSAVFGSFGLAVPLLVAPTTPHRRAARIAACATGFVYVVSRMGVTGIHSAVGEIADQIAFLRKCTETPIVVGFGVASSSDVKALAPLADGIIVGSALVHATSRSANPADAVAGLKSMCEDFSAACRRHAPGMARTSVAADL
jgi:tryptophan synthase alpha chain